MCIRDSYLGDISESNIQDFKKEVLEEPFLKLSLIHICLVRIDQLLQLLDDRLLDLAIRLLLGFEVGDERIAAAAVLLSLIHI